MCGKKQEQEHEHEAQEQEQQQEQETCVAHIRSCHEYRRKFREFQTVGSGGKNKPAVHALYSCQSWHRDSPVSSSSLCDSHEMRFSPRRTFTAVQSTKKEQPFSSPVTAPVHGTAAAIQQQQRFKQEALAFATVTALGVCVGCSPEDPITTPRPTRKPST